MKLVVVPPTMLSLSLLVCASACDDGKVPPTVEAARDGKGGAEAKTGEAKSGEAKAGEAKAAEVKAAEAKAADAKAGEAKAGEAKAAEAKAGSVAQVIADAKAGAEATADADAKPTEPTPPTKPGVDPSALYWASPSGPDPGRTTIDVIGMPDGEAIMKLADAHGQPDGITAAFPPSATLPSGFAMGDEWVVATTTGEVRSKAAAFGAYGGASETHFIVVLDAAATGLAAKAGAWSGPIPSMRQAKPIDTAKGPGKALFESIKVGMAAAAEPAAKKALARKPIAAKHASVIEGRFPNGFTHLVALVRPLAKAEEIGSEHVAGLFLADATGRVEAIFAPAMTINHHDFLYLVDLEGDGVDEVVYDDSYYEGSYTVLMTWDAAGKAVPRTLTGDGA